MLNSVKAIGSAIAVGPCFALPLLYCRYLLSRPPHSLQYGEIHSESTRLRNQGQKPSKLFSINFNRRLYNLILECVPSHRRQQITVSHSDGTTISPPYTYLTTCKTGKSFSEGRGSQKLFVNAFKTQSLLSFLVSLFFSSFLLPLWHIQPCIWTWTYAQHLIFPILPPYTFPLLYALHFLATTLPDGSCSEYINL